MLLFNYVALKLCYVFHMYEVLDFYEYYFIYLLNVSSSYLFYEFNV